MATPDGALRVSSRVIIPETELDWRFSTSGGPGGQHANTANTRVELRFSIDSSRALGPRQRARLLARLGPIVRVVVSDERSQLRNRALARERLAERIAEALRVQPRREPSMPTRASKERRLKEKKLASRQKQLRRVPIEG